MSALRTIASLLGVSLLGNVFGVAYYWGDHNATKDWLIERAALPPEIEQRLPKEIAAKSDELRPLVLELRSARQAMIQALTAKPLDEPTVHALAATVRAKTTALQEAFQGILVEAAKPPREGTSG